MGVFTEEWKKRLLADEQFKKRWNGLEKAGVAGDYWVADNSSLRAQTPGLGLRRSTNMWDKDADLFVPWGAVIKAKPLILEGKCEWIVTRRQGGLRYLPRF